MDSRAIGVFDSGLGGLTVRQAICERLPHESIIYLGDGANCPYGSRSNAEIYALTSRAVEQLIAEGCKLIVIACNTATAASINQLRASYPDMPFVGMEPAIKPACELTRSGVVGVLATERSLTGELYLATLAKYASNVEVISRCGEHFVELVEQGVEKSDRAEEVVRPIIMEMIEAGVDQIVLGCTHYPYLRETFEKVIDDKSVNIIDPAPAIAKRVEQLLRDSSLLCDGALSPRYTFRTFANDDYLQRIICRAESK